MILNLAVMIVVTLKFGQYNFVQAVNNLNAYGEILNTNTNLISSK
jgi:hypothetical protein